MRDASSRRRDHISIENDTAAESRNGSERNRTEGGREHDAARDRDREQQWKTHDQPSAYIPFDSTRHGAWMMIVDTTNVLINL